MNKKIKTKQDCLEYIEWLAERPGDEFEGRSIPLEENQEHCLGIWFKEVERQDDGSIIGGRVIFYDDVTGVGYSQYLTLNEIVYTVWKARRLINSTVWEDV